MWLHSKSLTWDVMVVKKNQCQAVTREQEIRQMLLSISVSSFQRVCCLNVNAWIKCLLLYGQVLISRVCKLHVLVAKLICISRCFC